MDSDASPVSSARTSSSAFLDNADAPWLLERVASTVLLPPEHFESPQICHYAPGQKYLPHHDGFSTGSDDLKAGGNRVATIICYLNDEGIEGGATKFPLCDVEVAPKQGSACLFFPSSMDGALDEQALHGGSEVARGEKWLAQIWVRQRPWTQGG